MTGSKQSPFCLFVLLFINDAHTLPIQCRQALFKHLIIAQSLVDQPKAVTVSEAYGNQITVLELKVGKVIGKQGRTAQAMRTILSAVSSKDKNRAVLEIIE